jgi:hypothetical protein
MQLAFSSRSGLATPPNLPDKGIFSRVRNVNGCPPDNEFPGKQTSASRRTDGAAARPLRIDVPVDETLRAIGERLVAVIGPVVPTNCMGSPCFNDESVLTTAQAALALNRVQGPCSGTCGYGLADKGTTPGRSRDGWGHRSITSTAVYTALAPNRFKDFWRD